MSNYPIYQFGPQGGQYAQQLQQAYQLPAYQAMQPPVQQQIQAAEQPLFCRVVTSKEEALAVPVDFSGRPMTLLDTAHGRVWIKVFNPATGSAELDEYCKAVSATKETPPEPPAFASVAALEALERKVDSLSEELAKARRRRTQHEREAVDDEL